MRYIIIGFIFPHLTSKSVAVFDFCSRTGHEDVADFHAQRRENVAFFGELDEELFRARVTEAGLREVLQDEQVQVDLGFLDDHIE